MNQISIGGPVTAGITSISGAFATLTLGDAHQIVAIMAGVVAVFAGAISIVIGFEKYRALVRKRRFDASVCKSKCEDPSCKMANCKIASVLGQVSKDDDE